MREFRTITVERDRPHTADDFRATARRLGCTCDPNVTIHRSVATPHGVKVLKASVEHDDNCAIFLLLPTS